MNKHFIVMDASCWGGGETIEKATKNFKKAGGRKVIKLFRFTSELPFAPSNRDATEDEADAYVTRYGELVSIRCQQID